MRDFIKSNFPATAFWASSRRQYWREYFLTGEWELRELARLVDRQRGAIDVGGNMGVYSYHLSRLATWTKVFEPNPDYADRLGRLHLPNMTVENVALSNAAGAAELRIPKSGSGEDLGMGSLETGAVGVDNLSRSVPVETRTLDSYRYRGVGFIKIDVEGHEEAVLDGAMETIRHEGPSLLIEIEERHNPGGIERITKRLEDLGYYGSYFVDGLPHSISEFDSLKHQVVTADLQNAGHNRRSLRYFNNFLFQPRRTHYIPKGGSDHMKFAAHR